MDFMFCKTTFSLSVLIKLKINIITKLILQKSMYFKRDRPRSKNLILHKKEIK